jgi:hypothetical protein
VLAEVFDSLQLSLSKKIVVVLLRVDLAVGASGKAAARGGPPSQDIKHDFIVDSLLANLDLRHHDYSDISSTVPRMTENVPPGSASKVATKEDAGSRGLPYYEKLRRDLRDTLNRKRQLDRNLVSNFHRATARTILNPCVGSG